MTTIHDTIIVGLCLIAAVVVIMSMTQCVQKYNTEQNAIQLAHELR